MLRPRPMPRSDVAIETVMMIDSLDWTMRGRAEIVSALPRGGGARIVVTHGTDTMVETARALAGAALERQDDRPHRRDGALRVRQLGRPLQPGQRAVVRAGAAAGRLRRDERAALPVERGEEEPARPACFEERHEHAMRITR